MIHRERWKLNQPRYTKNVAQDSERAKCRRMPPAAAAPSRENRLLGVYALLAGVWGLFYAVGRRLARFRLAAAAAYGLHALAALVIVLWTPFGFGWKCLLVAGSAAFWPTPPVVWRLSGAYSHRAAVRSMIANILNVAIGLWLAYSAIFSTPPGSLDGGRLALTALAAIILAAWARRSDRLKWQSGSNI